MRFAYIDSNGNEVPIPSVDALALRIELGAITENTQLYDAQADEWGPAHTHEIFHSLSRDAAEDDAFVAPPPVTPPSVAPPGGEDASVEAADETTEPPPDAEGGPDAEADEAAPSPDEGAVDDAQPTEEDTSFGLTLAEPPPGDEEATKESAAEASEAEDVDTGLPDLDLAPADDPTAAADPGADEPPDHGPGASDPALESAETAAEPRGSDEAVFDFGGLEDELEVEESFEASEEEPMDLSTAPEADAGDLGGGMELETAMEFDAGGFDAGDDSSLDLETPMSQFTPDEPPSWMDEREAAGEDDVLDFSSVSAAAEEEGEGDVPLRERRTPRNKPSPPKLRKQRNLALPIVVVVLLLAVGIGGYVAWPVVSERLASQDEPDVPEVVMPPLSDELMPVMREASEAALGAVFEQARTAWAESNPVQEPPSEWLDGIYLANAGDYEQAEAFWSGMSDFVERVRGIELAAFDAALAVELRDRGATGADADAIRERADSGFVAATPERTEVFDRFEAVVDASLALHAFLVANQDNIEYAPATVVTTDPVLEVNPATPEIRQAMEELLDEVLATLRAFEYPGTVTAEGLRDTLRSRIQEQGVR